jgi:hypothetical protein
VTRCQTVHSQVQSSNTRNLDKITLLPRFSPKTVRSTRYNSFTRTSRHTSMPSTTFLLCTPIGLSWRIFSCVGRGGALSQPTAVGLRLRLWTLFGRLLMLREFCVLQLMEEAIGGGIVRHRYCNLSAPHHVHVAHLVHPPSPDTHNRGRQPVRVKSS